MDSLLQRYRNDRRKFLEFLMSSGLVTELRSPSDSSTPLSPADLDALSADYVLDCVKSGGVVDVIKGTEKFNFESSYPITIHSGSRDSYFLVSSPDVAGSPPSRIPPQPINMEICSNNGPDMPCHIDNTPSSRDNYIFKEEAPKVKKEKHRIMFSTGFFVGCSVSLVIALDLFIHARNIIDADGHKLYMETMFPLYRRNRAWLWTDSVLSFGLGSLALAAVLINLVMEMDPNTNDYKTITESLPLFIVGLVIAISICPFNIFYRSSRFFLLMVVFRCIAAPLYKVSLPDFFLADQLTSQVQALRSLEFYICYYGWGDFRLRQNTCRSNDVYSTFYFIVAVIPYWSRFLQCVRRLIEEKDSSQGYNALKYLLTIVAVCLRTAYSLNRGNIWKIAAWVFSALATCYGTYWDIVFDWGLLHNPSKNWLREKLLVPHKAVYYVAMVLNVVLRLAWLQTVLDFNFLFLHRETMVALLAILEIIRRGIWNFFRLENEHLNNVGKFRAFKSVPLPFNYEEEEEEDSR